MTRLTSGITESLGAPGIALPSLSPRPFAVRGEGTLGDLQSLASSLGIMAVDRQRRILAESRQERLQQQALAARHAALDIVKYEDQIRTDQLMVPDGEDPAAFASRLIDSQVAGHTEGYSEEYRSRMESRILDMLLTRNRQHAEEARDDLVANLADLATGAESPEEVADLISAAEELGLSRRDAIDRLLTPALRLAGAQGNTEAIGHIAANLGDGQLSLELQSARSAAEARASRDRNAQIEAASSEVFRLINFGESLNRIDAEITASIEPIDPELAFRLRQTARTALEQTTAAMSGVAKREAQNEYASRVNAAVVATLEEGTAYGLPDAGFTLEFPDLTTFQISRDEAVDRAMDTLFQSYDAAVRDGSMPAADAFTRKVDVLSRNGLQYGPWKRQLHAAFASTAMIGTRSEDERGFVPSPALQSGFDLYRSLNAYAPSLAAAHVSGADEAMFYDVADLAMRFTDPGNSEAALLRAWQATQVDAARLQSTISLSLSAEDLRRAWKKIDVKTGFGGELDRGDVNYSEAAGTIERLARLYMLAPGLDQDTAITAAASTFERSYRKINGVWIYTADRNVADLDVDAVSDELVRRYMLKFGAKAGEDPDDLFISPIAGDTRWLIRSKSPGFTPAERWDDYGLFTTQDLLRVQDELIRDATRSERTEAIRSTVRRANAPEGRVGKTTLMPKRPPQ